MSFKPIPLAIDGGALAWRAARTGPELSRALGTEIVYAAEPLVDDSGEIGLPADVLLEASSSETEAVVRHAPCLVLVTRNVG